MPDAQGKPLPGENGYQAPQPAQPAGLINTAPQAPAQASATTPTASAFTVEPNATVASNVRNIVAEDSPLMQQAAARAAGQMNARGLLNSSQAIGAAHSAVYDAALPIAQADAATHARAAEQTTLARNTAELQRANIETSTSQFNVNAQNTQRLQEIENTARDKIAKLQADTTLSVTDRQIAANEIQSIRDNDTKLAMQRFELEADLQKIDADGKVRQSLVELEAQYKIIMQTSAGAADLHRQALASAAAIIADPNIADKGAALNLMVQQLNDALALIGDVGNMDLGSYLTFEPTAPPAPPTFEGMRPPLGLPNDSGGSSDSSSN